MKIKDCHSLSSALNATLIYFLAMFHVTVYASGDCMMLCTYLITF
jgi:hypothetical protein